VGAAWYRVRRVFRSPTAADGWVFRSAVAEGMIWGLAVWVKPHVIPIAAVVWLVVQPRLAGSATGGWHKLRRCAIDFAGSLLGGLIVGGAGAAYLVGSGTWPYMIDVFTNWAPSYFD